MRLLIAWLLLCFSILWAETAIAQIAHHPFAVGANEGSVGAQGGFGAWIIAQESRFYQSLTSALRALKTGDGPALLIGLSFAYGVFHAAGPGHGKAVITSYMVANEVALRRGLAISLAAALLQGVMATAIVGVAALVFGATGAAMTKAAQYAELASYLGIIGLGIALTWRKGRALAAAWRPARTQGLATFATAAPHVGSWAGTSPSGRFIADSGHRHGPACGCGHIHLPEPEALAGTRFDWKAAGGAVVTAGARPCSGAILVLVFALSQGLFAAGIAATFAMALGTAITTGLLATIAVFAKDLAVRSFGGSSMAVTGRVVELAASVCVLLFGITLLAAALSGFHVGTV